MKAKKFDDEIISADNATTLKINKYMVSYFTMQEMHCKHGTVAHT